MIFTSWELWQQMTFVLGCCIVIVFGLGLLRLWFNSRVMRRLERLDEEKRARRVDMRRCGIDAWRANDIPFGVRALHRGVEVEGIWISRADTSEFSQVASSTTLIGDSSDTTRENFKPSWTMSLDSQHNCQASSNAGGDKPLPKSLTQAQPHVPTFTNFGPLVPPSLNGDYGIKQAGVPLRPQLQSFPRGAKTRLGYRHDDSKPLPATPSTTTTSKQARTRRLETSTQPQEHGLARVKANRQPRKVNEGFEILPAGSLGLRADMELHREENQDDNHTKDMEMVRGRLRKKPRVPERQHHAS